jgi:hypothetical protein
MTPVVPTTTGKKPYCTVSSEDPDSSNFQLFSLRQAFKYWEELPKAKREAPEIREYLAFIIVCAGTSISQLLGQNAVHPGPGDYVQPPKQLFLKVFGKQHPKRKHFVEFIDVYDDCRHFGLPKHPKINALTKKNCQGYLNLIVFLWDEVVNKYLAAGHDSGGELADFKTVRDLV